MPKLRDISQVSAGEMVQAVMSMVEDGMPPGTLANYDQGKPVGARQKKIAEKYIGQFDPIKLEKIIEAQLEKYAPGKTLMEFVIEQRFAQMFCEKSESAKLNCLDMLERMAITMAAAHPTVQARLNCRKAEGVAATDTGSPFGDQTRKLKIG